MGLPKVLQNFRSMKNIRFSMSLRVKFFFLIWIVLKNQSVTIFSFCGIFLFGVSDTMWLLFNFGVVPKLLCDATYDMWKFVASDFVWNGIMVPFLPHVCMCVWYAMRGPILVAFYEMLVDEVSWNMSTEHIAHSKVQQSRHRILLF